MKTKRSYISIAAVILIAVGVIAGICKVSILNNEYAEFVENNVKIIDKAESQTINTTEVISVSRDNSNTVQIPYERYEVEIETTKETGAQNQNKNETEVKENINTSLEIPYGDTSFYAYMDYTCITDVNSKQYKLQQMCWTDSQGIRRQGDDVCIALGSYYGTNIGDRYLITTDTGNSYTAVLADCKSDIHTDINNQYRNAGYNKLNVIEFVVDTANLDYSVRTSGNIGTYDNYSGQIVSIIKLD